MTVTAGDQTVEVASDASGDPLAFVFKTIADPYVGQISLMRIRSGTLKPDIVLSNSRSGSDEKLSKIATMVGKETVLLDSAPAGDIVAVGAPLVTFELAGDAPAAAPVGFASTRPSSWQRRRSMVSATRQACTRAISTR